MKAAIEALRRMEMGCNKASRNVIICLPPHNAYKMQPLDKAFMGPPKTYYCHEIEKRLRSKPGRFFTLYPIGKLFGN
jgi:hypothetical protein